MKRWNWLNSLSVSAMTDMVYSVASGVAGGRPARQRSDFLAGQHMLDVEQHHEFSAALAHAGDEVGPDARAERRRRLDVGGVDVDHRVDGVDQHAQHLLGLPLRVHFAVALADFDDDDAGALADAADGAAETGR